MLLLRQYLRRDLQRLVENGVRLQVIGRRDRLPDGLAQEIATAEAASALGTRLALNVAIDYSARDAIANAAAGWLGDDSPSRAAFGRLLAWQGHGTGRDVDLLIRTGGEKRLSDFLLWECAYAELCFVDTCWPDFGAEHLRAAVADFRTPRAPLRRPARASRRNDSAFTAGEERIMSDTTTSDPTRRRQARSVRPPETPRRTACRARPISLRSRSTRSLLIAGLAIATVLPNLFISNLIEERETRQDGVRQEFTRNWGPEQNLYSPTLVIPYQAGERPRQYVKIAPARLDLAATLNPQERKRGLFHATVYDAKAGHAAARSWCRPRRACAISSPTRTGASSGTKPRSHSARPTSLTGLRATDNIVVDDAEQQWVPCLEALRQEPACRGAALVLANAPLTPALDRQHARRVQIDA